MSIRDTMQPAFGAAFNGPLAEAVKPFTGSYTTQGGYDPVTETSPAQTVTYTGRGVLSAYKAALINGIDIMAGDMSLLALTNEVTGLPAIGHKITAPAPVTGLMTSYDVKQVAVDPANVAYKIQLRGV